MSDRRTFLRAVPVFATGVVASVFASASEKKPWFVEVPAIICSECNYHQYVEIVDGERVIEECHNHCCSRYNKDHREW